MPSISDIIEDLGGLQGVSGLLGVSPQAVWNMKSRGSIPPKHWPVLVRAAREKGQCHITLDTLEAVHIGAESTNTPAHSGEAA